jgi:hypothetical protein
MYRRSPTLRIKRFWLTHSWLGLVFLVVTATVAFTWWVHEPTFRDPDSFYHLKISEIMMQRHAAVTEFPWLPFTTLKEAFVDHHFLYHLFVIPFILAFGSFSGMKVATIVLGVATIALFWLVLRGLGVRYPEFFAVILLAADSFTFRMALSKAPSVAFLFLVGGFFCLVTRRWRWLGVISFFFVWAYGGFLLLPIAAVIYALVELIVARRNQQPLRAALRQAAIPVSVSVGGTLAGLLINPAFPQNLWFYWEQVVQIGLVNYQKVIGVGAEWYPFAPEALLTDSVAVTLLLAIGGGCALLTLRKQSTASLTALGLTAIFFAFTLKSHRYIEYFIPWAVLASALALHDSGVLHRLPQLVRIAWKSMNHHPLAAAAGVLAGSYLLFATSGVLITGVQETARKIDGGIPITDFADAGRWLRTHSTRGDIIFHSNWDTFPQMFYHVQRGRYIAGLDPTFFYKQNPDLYQEWVDITTGRESEFLLETISEDFGARFVVIENDHTGMLNNIRADGRFLQTYSDADYTIFRVRRPQL